MPINIPDNLPAVDELRRENIFVMTHETAAHQDIRPLKIAILNLMPKKIETETQLLRLLSNTPLQVDIEFLQTASHVSKNTSVKHLNKFYKTFEDVRDQRFDGLIITGAPVEQMDFGQVSYCPPDNGLVADQCFLGAAHLLGGAGRALSSLRCEKISAAQKDVRSIPPPDRKTP